MGHEHIRAMENHDHELEIGTVNALALHPIVQSTTGTIACTSICPFTLLKTHPDELENRANSSRKLMGLIAFALLAMAVEIIGGIKSNSLAVLTDAIHMFSDVAGFAISLFAAWASGWNPTSHQSFGYYRLEVLGALLSVQLIWLISGFLMYEAFNRILHKSETIDGKVMFIVAAFGFLINLISLTWLGGHHHHHHAHSHSSDGDHIHDHVKEIDGESAKLVCDHSHEKTKKMNINLEGAYLHVVADLIQSIAVMISGAFIWAKPGWVMIDFICTSIFSVVVLISTWSMLRNVFGILMERTPGEIDIVRLENGLSNVEGVSEVHDLHVWSISSGKIVMSCHVKVEPGVGCREILHDVRQYCERIHRINHVTVQIDQE